ncbi:MAG: phage tail tube protein [Candidatus Njordarchaeales archaeon]
MANSLQMSVTQSDVMNINMDIIGLTRDKNSADIEDNVGTPDSQDNSRVVTWADSRIQIDKGGREIGLGGRVGGQFVRSFEVNVNNNAARFYTLNKALFAQAVAPAKRDVTGNIVFMGRLDGLGELARTNEDYAYEDTSVTFGFKPSVGSTEFTRRLPNVVFQIEEMAITNDLFETTMQYHSLPAAFIAGSTTNATYDPLLSEDFTIDY